MAHGHRGRGKIEWSKNLPCLLQAQQQQNVSSDSERAVPTRECGIELSKPPLHLAREVWGGGRELRVRYSRQKSLSCFDISTEASRHRANSFPRNLPRDPDDSRRALAGWNDWLKRKEKKKNENPNGAPLRQTELLSSGLDATDTFANSSSKPQAPSDDGDAGQTKRRRRRAATAPV